MLCRGTRSRVSETSGSLVHIKSLLLRILFVILNDFWISNGDFGIICLTIRYFIRDNRYRISPAENLEGIHFLHIGERYAIVLIGSPLDVGLYKDFKYE